MGRVWGVRGGGRWRMWEVDEVGGFDENLLQWHFRRT
jgi:hypothetical protein